MDDVGAEDLALAVSILKESRARLSELINAPEHRDARKAHTDAYDAEPGTPGAAEMGEWMERRARLARIINALD